MTQCCVYKWWLLCIKMFGRDMCIAAKREWCMRGGACGAGSWCTWNRRCFYIEVRYTCNSYILRCGEGRLKWDELCLYWADLYVGGKKPTYRVLPYSFLHICWTIFLALQKFIGWLCEAQPPKILQHLYQFYFLLVWRDRLTYLSS